MVERLQVVGWCVFGSDVCGEKGLKVGLMAVVLHGATSPGVVDGGAGGGAFCRELASAWMLCRCRAASRLDNISEKVEALAQTAARSKNFRTTIRWVELQKP